MKSVVVSYKRNKICSSEVYTDWIEVFSDSLSEHVKVQWTLDLEKIHFWKFEISDVFTDKSENSLILALRTEKNCIIEHITEKNDSSLILSLHEIKIYIIEAFTDKNEGSVNLAMDRMFGVSLICSLKFHWCSHLVNVHLFRWTFTQIWGTCKDGLMCAQDFLESNRYFDVYGVTVEIAIV